MNIINTILDILFPESCISCRKGGLLLCSNCVQKIRPAERENPEWIYSRYDYRDPIIKKAIWLMKYRHKRTLADFFASTLYDMLLEEMSERYTFRDWVSPIVIPIPLAQKRLRERGFNQSALIARKLVKLDTTQSLSYTERILIKPKDTIHQAHIKNRQKRLENIEGSFSVIHPEKIKGRTVILIDDVTTTGATLSEARKILKKAGAKTVIAFTIAH